MRDVAVVSFAQSPIVRREEFRNEVARRMGSSVAESLRILYGGSVKPENAHELMAEPDVDGALVGGASLDVTSFAEIVTKSRPAAV